MHIQPVNLSTQFEVARSGVGNAQRTSCQALHFGAHRSARFKVIQPRHGVAHVNRLVAVHALFGPHAQGIAAHFGMHQRHQVVVALDHQRRCAANPHFDVHGNPMPVLYAQSASIGDAAGFRDCGPVSFDVVAAVIQHDDAAGKAEGEQGCEGKLGAHGYVLVVHAKWDGSILSAIAQAYGWNATKCRN